MYYEFREGNAILEKAKEAIENKKDFRIGDFFFVYNGGLEDYCVFELDHPTMFIHGNFKLDLEPVINHRKSKLDGYRIEANAGMDFRSEVRASIYINSGEFVCH